MVEMEIACSLTFETTIVTKFQKHVNFL